MKNRILIFLLACLPFIAHAQLDNQPVNMPKYDMQKIHFGFVLAMNSSSFHIDRAPDIRWRDSIYSVEANKVSGLNLGIVSNVRIGDYFDFRFIPALSFQQRNLVYSFVYDDSIPTPATKKIESTYLEFPFQLKYKSKRANNYRVYVIGGVKYAIDMVSQAKVNEQDKDIVKLVRNDFGYEVGIGFDFYLTYFKFSPEIKMYNGVQNLLKTENTPYSSPMSGLFAKTFFLSFYFE